MTVSLGTIDGRAALRFERHLVHPVQRVWRAIVVPTELERWFPAVAGDWTPEAGKTFESGGQTGQVTALEAPHLIEWTFAGQLFRFELTAEQDGCALVFTHVFGDRATAAQTAAGWECYFDRLSVHLAGGHLSQERAHEPIGERHEHYAARFGIDPTPGRQFIATAMGFRGLALEDGPVLRLRRRYKHQAALAAAGWDRCFAVLDAHLAGQSMSQASALALWPAVHERYASIWGIDPEIGRAVFAEHSPA